MIRKVLQEGCGYQRKCAYESGGNWSVYRRQAHCAALGITLPELLNGKDSPQKEEMQLTHDAQMLDLLRRMQRTVYEQHILYGVLLILLGIASNALSALVGGSHVKEFFSGVLMGMSVAEMLAGVVIVAIHVIHGKCEE